MPRKALVVEGDVPTGRLLSESLDARGWEITLLALGERAFAWARLHLPDVVFVGLPAAKADGFDLCRELKLAEETSLIPVVAVTTPDAAANAGHGLVIRADGYLTKPFTADQVEHALTSVLAWRDEARRLGTREEISFHLSSDTVYLEALIKLLAPLFPRAGMTQPHIMNLITALRELGTNAIEWGHRKQIEEIVTIDYLRDASKIAIHICDQGPGFNPANLPHAARADDPIAHLEVRESLGMREGGFGIMMARGLVDELEYNETGNEVRLVKYLPVQAPAASAASTRSGP
jgi:anti-sigma regulatory factor (Ser/Thr protein kinase)/ActR/RegA family two-component response regulator